MKKHLTIFTALVLFSFFSCETSELELNDGQNDKKGEIELTGCETAFASSDHCFSEDGFNRWGWVLGPFSNEDKTRHEIWAGAGQCDLDHGTFVGYLYIDYLDGVATITYDGTPGSGYVFTETHLYVGNGMYPLKRNGRPTVAPGQYPYNVADQPITHPRRSIRHTVDDLRDEIYVIAHAVVCEGEKDDDNDDDDAPN